MSDISYDWAEEQVGDLQDKSPDNKDAWISNALKGKNRIVNARDVFVIQSALKSLWYDPGKIDGVYREKWRNTSYTITAVRDFQAENWLAVDGQVWPKTIAKLIEKLGTPPPVGVTRGVTFDIKQPVETETPSPTEEIEKLWSIKLASSASTEFKRLWIHFKEGINNAQLLQFAPWKEYYIDIMGGGKNTTYTSESVVKEWIWFVNDTESIVFKGWQFIITNKDNTREYMRVRPIVRSRFEPTKPRERVLLERITSQWFEVKIDPTEHETRQRQLYLYKDGLKIHSALASIGNIPALDNFMKKIPYILDPTRQGREDAEEEKRNAMRRQQSRQEAQARRERESAWETLWDVLPKSKAKLTTLDGLKIAPQNVSILRQAEAKWFTFAYDGSRSNGINIIYNNQIVWNVLVFANASWQDQLVTMVQGLVGV